MRLVLIQDRIDLSPDKMDQMKQEIWEVVSRYMVVDDDFLEFEVRRLDELVMLVSHSRGQRPERPGGGALGVR